MPNKLIGLKHQDASYRRGLVLGLTMAEIMVLVLFTLLLALTSAIATREADNRKLTEQVDTLKAVEDQIAEMEAKNPQGINVADIIQQISRQRKTIDTLQTMVDDLKSKNPDGVNVTDIMQKITRQKVEIDRQNREIQSLRADAFHQEQNAEDARKWNTLANEAGLKDLTPEKVAGIVKSVQQFAKANHDLASQLSQLGEQIRRSGRGNEFPSCWATPDGKIESIFEILLKPGGIVIFERNLSHRSASKAELPISDIRYSTELEVAEFKREVRPLYEWSVNKKCRFYVIIFSSETEVRTDEVNAVNAFFYPDSRITLRRETNPL